MTKNRPYPWPNPLDVFECLECGELQSRRQVEIRTFNTGWCACGGRVEPKANLDVADGAMLRARELERKMYGGRRRRAR